MEIGEARRIFDRVVGVVERDAVRDLGQSRLDPVQDRAGAQPIKKETNLIEGISSPDFGYVPSYIARAKGFLANEGVDLKIVVMRATVSVPALVSGEIQFAVHGSAMTAAMRR